MKTKLLLLAFFAQLFVLTTSAYDAVVNGIYYNLNGKEATVTCKSINYNGYQGNIVIPSSIQYNGITYSVTSVGEGAFMYCNNLTSVVIPNGVTSIGRSAFNSCYNLTSVVIPNSVVSIDSCAFRNCRQLTSVELPDSIKRIDSFTFFCCSSLPSIIIPANVTSIGSCAFYNCSSLTSIVIPTNVTSIGSFAFSACGNLASVDMPDNVRFIGRGAFEDCDKWYNAQPDGLIYLGSIAYKYKGTMLDSTSITLREGTTAIGAEAFMGCHGLCSVEVPNSVTFIGGEAFDSTMFDNNLPEGLCYLGRVAYKYKGKMPANTSITLKMGTTSIGERAFAGCVGLNSIEIPNSVTHIGSYAFNGCNNLSSMEIPSSVECLGSYILGDWYHPNNTISDVYVHDVKTLASSDFYDYYDLYYDYYDLYNGMSVAFAVREATLHVPEGWKNPSPYYGWFNCFSNIVDDVRPEHDVIYMLNDEVYRIERTPIESELSLIAEPTIEGHTFVSGWSKLPTWMPAHDVIVRGKLITNRYLLTYILDNDTILRDTVYYDTPLTPLPEPTKNGYGFSGWTEVPDSMPAHDVTVMGYFTPLANINVDMGTQHICTYTPPIDLDFSDVSGLKAYIASGFNPSTGVMTLTRVQEVPAGEGLLLKGEAGEYEVPYTETNMYYSNLLKGLITATVVAPVNGRYTNFILADGEQYGVGFYPLSKTGEVAAGKAYLQLPTSVLPVAGARTVKLLFADEDNETTGITYINNGAINENLCSSLDGRRIMGKPAKGLYVIGGRKVLVK